jgi:UDP-glucose 4-epimerase
MNHQRNILVTGGAGFIGSHTLVALFEAGYTPVIVDDFRGADMSVPSRIEKIIGYMPQFLNVDVCDKAALKQVFEQHSFDGIIHFAAYKAVGESVQDPLKYYKNNLLGLVNTLELALEFGVSNFVFSSSCTVYGEPGEIKEVTEDLPKGLAASPYGNTKIIGEEILNDVHQSSADIKIVSLRYFNPIGAHASGLIGEFPIGKPNNLLPMVTGTAIGKFDQLTVFGSDYPTADGTCVRDYIHVMDLAAAHVKALEFLESGISSFETINIGTGEGTSILKVIQVFEALSEVKLNWKFGAKRPGDVVEIFANADKANHLLNWHPKYTLEDSVQHAWNWEKKLQND